MSIGSSSTSISSNMSICMISLEEHQFQDGNSNIELLIESRLPTTLDLILDKNTQLLFDQDMTNFRLYIARSLDKSSTLGLLCCIRNMGWEITASNGYYHNDVVIRKFYYEKSIDLSKIQIIEPLKSKRNSRMAFHFDTTTKQEPNSSRTASNLAEFSRAIDSATQETLKNNEEFPRPSALKPRRSSIAEGKPSLVFKQLAERRKISTNSSHPLDPKFADGADANSPIADRIGHRASSSPPPLKSKNTIPFSNAQSEEIKSLKKGNVGGLASMFANQLAFQPGAPPPMRKKQETEMLTGDQQLTTPTTSRPMTEKKRRPTSERRSIHISNMRMPLVASTSFDENDANRLGEVKEGDDDSEVEKKRETQPPHPEPAERKLTNTNLLLLPLDSTEKGSSEETTPNHPKEEEKSHRPFSDPPSSQTRVPFASPTQPPQSSEKPIPSPSQKPSPPSLPPPAPPSAPSSNKPPPPASSANKSPPPMPATSPPRPPPPAVEPPPSSQAPPPPAPATQVPPQPPATQAPPPPPATQAPPPPIRPSNLPPNKPTPPPPMPPPRPSESTPTPPSPRAPSPPPPSSLISKNEEQEVTISFDEERFSNIDRGSDRPSAESRNAAYFRQMKEEEERKKQEKLQGLSPEERERLSLEEEAVKAHDSNKVSHFAKLGKSFTVSSASKLLNGGRGRNSGRGSAVAKKSLP